MGGAEATPRSWAEMELRLQLRALEKQCQQWMAHEPPAGQPARTRTNLRRMAARVTRLAQRHPPPSPEDLRDYRDQVQFLTRTLAHLAPPTRDPSVALGVDVPGLALTRDSPLQFPRRVGSAAPARRDSPAAAPLPVVRPYGVAPLPAAARQAHPVSQQLFRQLTERGHGRERHELLGQSDAELRRRLPVPVDGALSDLVQAHHDAQEQVAEEMIQLTRSLKAHSLAAGDIIRQDTASLERTNELAEVNRGRLGVEAERLSQHTRQLCRWWIWLIILIVTVTFVAMVMIMKVFRKRW